ncbi:MAG: PA2169 family four-helix-bundle protein [Acidobacteria bacterium]|nr:PA2169 family four-helix-bundle protein [Acidobacteriota bacterium]MCI0625466.1 PA2169 family four-helix-bundle protein [Acidobacteriota bacterium]MCI0721967.1 PA2169 family four-helix-bundle protein [Acidobacteriota bacterium]
MEPRERKLAINTLSHLLEICRESEIGFLRAASRSQKPGLKEFLGAEALQQALFIAELQLELRKLGVAVTPPAPGAAKLRGWNEIVSTRLLPSGDETVLLLCEQGERAALGEYLAILHGDLPVAVFQLVERQHFQLREAYDRLSQIREQLRKGEGTPGRDLNRDRLALSSPGRELEGE